MTPPDVIWQASLLDTSGAPRLDDSFAALTRVKLDATSWVDHARAWVSSSDQLFAELLAGTD